MEMTIDEFKVAVEKLEKKMDEYYKRTMGNKIFVCDGIVDADSYFNSFPYKILWILKEPYSGAGNYLNSIKVERAESNKRDSPNTWNPIAYVSYSILNSFKDLSKESIKTNKEINRIFKKIAIINVQKTEAGTQSKTTEIQNAYNNHKEIIKEQIELYEPAIIINCSGIKNFAEDLGYNFPIEGGHFGKGDKIIVNTYHPQQKRIKQKDYIDKIIQRVKQNAKIIS